MNKFNYLFLVLITLLSVGCAKKQPKCDDPGVKNILLMILRDKTQNESEKLYFEKNWNYSDLRSYAENNGLNVKNYIDEKTLELKQDAKVKVKPNIEIINIRHTNKSEESKKKCDCLTALIIDKDKERPIEIKYNAQYTESGHLYVELLKD